MSVRRRRFFQVGSLAALAGTLFAASPLLLTAATAGKAAVGTPIYQDTSYTYAERAADLVARMTPAQRASQLVSSQAPAIAALANPNIPTGISNYGWWNEALHGINAESTNASGNAATLVNTTSYPIDLSRGASWDPELTYRVAVAESDEAREVVRTNKLDLDFYSPTMNLARDPRWGRNDESYGEDPYLETKLAAQFVNGMEGKDPNGNLLAEGSGFYKTTTTLKHYAMNNSEVNRRSGSADADERTIREYYTKAFKDIIQSAHPGAVMSSYNSVNGVPTAASSYLIDTLLRQTFGLVGYLTGDCDAISAGINPQHAWQPAGFPHRVTVIESLAFALASGEDAECNAGFTNASNYRGPTAASTTAGGTMNAIGLNIVTPNGLHTVNDLDVSATRLFTNRMKLGEFNPDATVPWLVQARARVPQGTWTSGDSNNAVTETAARLALAREAGAKSLVLLKNATKTRKNGTVGKLLPIPVPASGTFKVLVTGFYGNNANFYLGGYSSTQSATGQAKEVTPYAGIKAAIQAINPAAQVDFQRGFTGTGTNAGNCCAIVDAAAVAAAPTYDYVIVYAGMDSTAASGTTGTEDRDRTAITLPGVQGSLINQIAAANPNTIAVMETIGPQDVTSFEPNVASILWSSYNGQRKGSALADVLLGAYNPSGRTPEIWYQNVGQIPAITNYSIRPVGTTGRTYMYYNGPLSYSFGYGLSYSTFSFSNLHIDTHVLDANDTFNVSADVTNTSGVAGNEVVQLYVSTPDADPSLQRPLKRLEGFQKVFLAAGETKTVTLAVRVPDLAFYDSAAGKWSVDNGRYGVQISTSSADADIQLQDNVNVTGSLAPVPSVVSAKATMPGDAARGISQRVMFPEGVVVNPGLTVSMNDETLYGFVEPGSSKPFPGGMTFAFASDRPDIVSVDAGGTIHTLANGAATVTATATYAGVSKSTQFAVRVLSDATGLKVNGKTLAGFNSDVFNYDVVVPDGVTATPQLSAGIPDDATSVLTQATGIPGVATLAVTGPDGLISTYRVNFARQSRSDEFAGTSLAPQWSFIRETTADWSLTANPGSLTITPKNGDITTTTNTARNLLLQPTLGDFATTTKIKFSAKPNAATQQGGVIAYQDDDNYLKFDLEATSATNVQFNTTLEETLNGVQVAQTLNLTPANLILPANNTIWLRMVKSGAYYMTSYSVDGTTFVPVWTTGAPLRNVKTGVVAFNRAGTTTSLQVMFDFVHVDSTPPAATPPPTTTTLETPAPVNGWVTQDATIALIATDNSGWGIASSTYSLDDAPPLQYTGPIPVTGDGVHTLDFFSTDNAGNIEATNSIDVRIDSTKPTVAVSPDRAPDHNGWYTHSVTFTATGNDGDGSGIAACGAPVVYGGPDSGAATPFSITCTDVAGNTGSASSGTFQYDATAPLVTVPADVTTEATGPSGATVDYPDATAVDALVGPLAANCLPASGSLFALGHTQVSCSATDLAGNTGTASFDVFVPDTSAPEVQAPADVVAEATGPDGAPVTYPDATAFDIVDGPVLASCQPPSGSTFPVGHTQVECSAFDTVGNRGSSFFDVQVVDTTPPVVHPHADIVANATTPSGTHVSFSLTADDIVDGPLTVTCAPPSDSLFAIGHTTVLCHATDAHDNTGSTSFDIYVKSGLVQLRDLSALVDSLDLQQGKSEKFINTLKNVVKHLGAGKTKQVCKELDDFIKKADKESGKSLTAAESDALIAAGTRIQAVLGC